MLRRFCFFERQHAQQFPKGELDKREAESEMPIRSTETLDKRIRCSRVVSHFLASVPPFLIR